MLFFSSFSSFRFVSIFSIELVLCFLFFTSFRFSVVRRRTPCLSKDSHHFFPPKMSGRDAVRFLAGARESAFAKVEQVSIKEIEKGLD